ncbi:putative RNA binding protein [Aspergillus undulatus]|uniref:putative RNA binding protein n=1 Tax=Aspergillus undulatus TaxID=1810928 RepID=UPI003CCE2B72
MEIRKRKVIRRYVYTDGGGICRRPKSFERDDYYYRRYAQHKRTEERHSPAYRIIETRESLRPRAGLNKLWRRDQSPVRSEPFTMRMPYNKRVSPAVDYYESRPRGRARSPRPFVVDHVPEIRYAWPKTRRQRCPSPDIRHISPRRRSCLRRPSSPPLAREETTVIVDDAPREGRSLERHNGPRRPRERTPVVEREPVRRRGRTVEIHQPPERTRQRSRNSRRRQVRFAEDVDYEEYDRPRRRDEPYHIDDSDDGRPRYRSPSPGGTMYRMTGASRCRRSETISEGARLRPRIIQDGNREISEAGDRIYGEARRRRRDPERDLHDFVSHSSSRLRRRVDDIREFSSDDESFTDSRRYGRRWL